VICIYRENILSYGNSNRTFSQRPVRRKKQDFHRHKIKVSKIRDSINFASLKDRTLLSLFHLGEQRFSEELGGYSLENWLKSLNLLLDEFEEQIGRRNLPSGYFAKRLELISSLARSIFPSSELDSQIAKKREEELMLRNAITSLQLKRKLAKETEERAERLKNLETEKVRCLELLEESKGNLAQKRKQIQDSKRILNRMFSSSKHLDQSSLPIFENRVKDLTAKIDAIDKKILDQRRRIELAKETSALEEAPTDFSALESKYEDVRLRLEELEKRKFEEMQLSEKRKEATDALREMISKLEVGHELTEVRDMQ
jgi:hypothetical protein